MEENIDEFNKFLVIHQNFTIQNFPETTFACKNDPIGQILLIKTFPMPIHHNFPLQNFPLYGTRWLLLDGECSIRVS